MELQSLGYIGIRADSIEEWAELGPNLFGLEQVERTRSALRFRMDDRSQRIVVTAEGGTGIAYLGFEVADAAALDRLGARLDQRGTAAARFSRSLAGERHVADGIAFADPAGNRLEAFCSAEIATEPFRPGRNISGFRTGALGMGHVVLQTRDIEPMRRFYQDVLGFALSDYFLHPFPIYFLHLNPRHHSIGLLAHSENRVHHLMIETLMLDDIGQGYDLAMLEENRIATTLGRHINDQVTSFYSHTPSGFMLEYGWGGRSIDHGNWTPTEVVHGPSMWGHERYWLPPEARAQSRSLRLKAAEEGVRAPVNVIDGNYRLAPGACPWFDKIRRSQ
ncbi:MAG: VOC family protein [Stellaceae bacterium]